MQSVFIRLISVSIWITVATTSVKAQAASATGGYLLINQENRLDISPDGSYAMEDFKEYRVLSDAGKMDLALQRVQYYPNQMRAKVLEAGVQEGELEYPVALTEVQKTRLPSAPGAHGLQLVEQLEIPFNNLKIGSVTTLRVRYQTVKKPAQTFSAEMDFGGEGEQNGKVIITSPSKPHYQISDPYSYLAVREQKTKRGFELHVKLKRPLDIARHSPPRLQYTLMKDWRVLAREELARYNLKGQPLPLEWRKVAATLAGKTPAEKASGILQWIAENYTYSGQWLAPGSEWQPHPLGEIAASKTGDCKDFAVTTLALLREAGVTAEPVLVGISEGKVSSPIQESDPIPMAGYFNHVVIRYKNNGHWQILDPGRGLADAERTPFHLNQVWALNLAESDGRLHRIIIDGDNYALGTIQSEIFHRPGGGYLVHSKAEFKGELSNFVKEIYFGRGPSEFEKNLAAFMAPAAQAGTSFHLIKLESPSRAPTPVHLEWEYTSGAKNHDNEALSYPPHWLPFDFPYQIHETVKISEGYVSDEYKYDCLIKGPRAHLDRRVSNSARGIEINDYVQVPALKYGDDNPSKNQLRLSAYDQRLKACLLRDIPYTAKHAGDPAQVSFESHLDTSKPYSAVPYRLEDESLYVKELRAIDFYLSAKPNNAQLLRLKAVRLHDLGEVGPGIYIRDYLRASNAILEKLAVEAPKEAANYARLGLNYFDMDDLPAAMKYFKQAFALSPKAFEPLYLGGLLSRQDRKWDLAMAYFKAAASYAGNQEDRLKAWDMQALILSADLHHQEEAIALYDRTLALLPESPARFASAGAAYQNGGYLPRAVEAYKKALSYGPNATAERGLLSCQLDLLRDKVESINASTNLDELNQAAGELYKKEPTRPGVLKLLIDINTAIANQRHSESNLTLAAQYNEELKAVLGKENHSVRRADGALNRAHKSLQNPPSRSPASQ